MANRKKDDDIDYTAEGETPPRGKEDPTDRGYDEAAHSGGRYGVREGAGGVFGTTGGGTYEGGFQIEERPAVDEGDDGRGQSGRRGVTERTPGTGADENE